MNGIRGITAEDLFIERIRTVYCSEQLIAVKVFVRGGILSPTQGNLVSSGFDNKGLWRWRWFGYAETILVSGCGSFVHLHHRVFRCPNPGTLVLISIVCR